MPLVEGYLEEKVIASPGRPAHPVAPGGTTPPWGIEGPVDPGYGVPLPPVVSHPIPPTVWPPQPGSPPTYPVDPDYGLPVPPTVWPQPPQPVPPVVNIPVFPSFPIYLPPEGETPELPPGSVWPPLPPSVTGIITCFIWVVGVGYRWTTIDTSLKPEHPVVIPPSTVPGVPTHPVAPGGGPAHPIDPGGQPAPTRRS
ncbi:MAG TPA: hypothetical protein VGF39_03975 [Stellaceae bacterium]|jgi:hypothetical protein